MRVSFIVLLCLVGVAFAASDSESQGTLNGYSPRNGDPIATTADVAIESDSSSFGAASAEPTFAEDPANVPRRNQMVSHRAPTSPQAQDDSDNPYLVRANKWDPEMMNVRAIERASSGLNDLLREVNAKIPVFRRKALRGYPDDGVMQQRPTPSVQAPKQQQVDDGPADDEFLEIQSKGISPIQRLRDRVHQQRRIDDIHASIELELEADASKPIVAGGIEKELDQELMALNSDPQLKEWEQEAQWKQQRTDVHGTLAVSDRLLSDLKGRYKDE